MANYTFRILILILFAGCFLSACEYISEKEFISEIEPPLPFAEIDINLSPQGDTLELFESTKIQYNFQSDGRPFYTGKITVGEQVFEISESIGEIDLNPVDFTPGYHVLKADLLFNSGTGSIADQLDAELYQAEKHWILVSDHREAPELSIHFHKNDDGFLALTWDSCTQYNFGYYELIRYSPWTPRSLAVISEPGVTTAIDSCHVGGESGYRLVCKVKGQVEVSTTTLNIETALPSLHFESLPADSVRISLMDDRFSSRNTIIRRPSPFPPDTLMNASFQSFAIAVNPFFGTVGSYELITIPAIDCECCNSRIVRTYHNYHSGEFLTTNYTNYAFNNDEKLIYATSDNEILLVDSKSLEIANSFPYDFDGYQPECGFSSLIGSHQLALSTSQNIVVFENKHLENPVFIDLGADASRSYLFLAQNDKVATVLEGQFRLYDVKTQQLTTAFDIVEMPEHSRWQGIGMSLDADYAGITTQNGLWLYQQIDNQYELIHHNSQSNISVLFDPFDSGKVYISQKDEPVLSSYRLPGIVHEQSWVLPEPSVICNIDPVSGYMLLNAPESNKAHVLNLENNDVLFSTNCSDFNPKLYNNVLFGFNGSAWDITNYLNKN